MTTPAAVEGHPAASRPSAGAEPRATPRVYLGLFCVTFATLMLELLLTRIFSVTMWAHYAFVAVSLALFGMTVGAVIVHVAASWFPQEAVAQRMALAAWLFGLTTVLAVLTHLAIPFVPRFTVLGIYDQVFLYVVLSVPFACSGICVCLALTRFPQQVSRLYAADLAGAAAGCVALAFLLGPFDGLSAVLVVAALAAAGGWAFAGTAPPRRWQWVSGLSALLLLALGARNSRTHALHIEWARARLEEAPAYEKWNAFSRIAIWDQGVGHPFGWGLSSTYRARNDADQKWLTIDAGAGTVLTRFDGNLGRVDYLSYDVTSIAYALEPQARTLVIGAGGGRDVLTGLVWGAREITAVEINGDIVRAVNGLYGDYTGHLDRLPGVRFVTADARSWVEASRDRFDLIQSSLIDTFAATAAGAFVLTENAVYTREAWASFLRHLSDRGLLSVSRWYVSSQPLEALRCVMLARSALEDLGVTQPRRHLILVRSVSSISPLANTTTGIDGIVTTLVKRQPFSDAELDAIEAICRRLNFEVVLSPRGGLPAMVQAIEAPDPVAFARASPLDISPPTDNRPFFFFMIHPRDAFRLGVLRRGATQPMAVSTLLLGSLLATVIVLSAACIAVPLGLSARRRAYRLESVPAGLTFFAAIGLGFMLIEISQMERLMIFLGHPMYGLTVALFALLVFSSLGSLLAGRIWKNPRRLGAPLKALAALLVVLAAFALVTPMLIHAGRAWPTPGRIGLALAALAPLGLVMGMPFPLGMRLAALFPGSPTAWFWGINGAMSVCGSVLAIVISLEQGIAAAFTAGILCYLVAAAAFWALGRKGAGAEAGETAPALERAQG